MPFKSQAQKKKFEEMVAQGKMSKEVFNEWNKETPAHLPERVEKKPSIKIRKAKVIK